MAMPTPAEVRNYIDTLNEAQLRALAAYATACADEDVAEAARAAALAAFQAATTGEE